MSGITAGQIQIEGSVLITRLLELRITIQANQHVTGYLSGRIEKEMVKKVLQLEENAWIQIKAVTPNETKNLLIGMIEQASVIEEGNHYKVRLELSSGTKQLDIVSRKRSFQNKNATYKEVIEKVMSEWKNGSFLWQEGTPQPVGGPIFQYEETDWEFLLRLANRKRTMLYPEWRRKGCHFWFGMPRSTENVVFSEENYQVGISSRYYELGGSLAGYRPEDFFYYQITSYEDYELGSLAQFQGRTLKICKKEMLLEQEELYFQYTVGTEALVKQKEVRESKLTGLTLTGTILSVKGEQVKLALEIDGGKQEEETAYPYLWTPDSGSVMYCMPKVGSKASLYFPCEKEEKAIVVHCVRTNGGSCEKMANSQKKGLSTEYGKELCMKEEKLELSCEKSGMKISLEDTAAVALESSKKIKVEGASIHMKGKTVTIETPVELRLSKK